MAGTTRLELATSCVTGMRSNQTELLGRATGYEKFWWAFTDSNRGPIGYEPTALTTELKALPPPSKLTVYRTSACI